MKKQLLIVVFAIAILFNIVLVLAFPVGDGLVHRAALGAGVSETAVYNLPDGQMCDVTWTLVKDFGMDQYDWAPKTENDIDGAIKDAETIITCTLGNDCTQGYTISITTDCQEPQCVEAWTCTDWGTCTNSQQARTCTDSENCGTTTTKPPETQACQEDPEDPQDPDPQQSCSESWTCSNWETADDDCKHQGDQFYQLYERDCTDSNACGTTTYKPSETQKVQCIEGESPPPPPSNVVDNQPASQQSNYDYEGDGQQPEENGMPTYIWVGAGVLGGMLAIFMIGGVVYMLRK